MSKNINEILDQIERGLEGGWPEPLGCRTREEARAIIDAYRAMEARAEAAEAKVARLTEALEPFAFTAEWDIDDTESDSQPFRQKDPREAIGGIITVGHFRAALVAMENEDAD